MQLTKSCQNFLTFVKQLAVLLEYNCFWVLQVDSCASVACITAKAYVKDRETGDKGTRANLQDSDIITINGGPVQLDCATDEKRISWLHRCREAPNAGQDLIRHRLPLP